MPEIRIIYPGSREALGNDRAASQITLLSQTDIEQLAVQSTAQLLSYVQGADLRQRGPGGIQADIGIQGSTFDQVLILVDGVRINDAQTGHHNLNAMIPLEAIQSIEVIKGAAASRYGLGALAGVINIRTLHAQYHNEEHKGPYIKANTYQGTSFENDSIEGFRYSNQGLRLAVQQNLKLGQSGYAGLIYAGSFENGTGYRPNTGYEVQRHFAKAGLYHPLIGSMNARYIAVNNAFGANAFYAAPGDRNSEETVNTKWFMLDQSRNWTRHQWTWDISSNYSYRTNNDHYVYIASNPSLYENFHWSQGQQFETRLSAQSRKTLFRIGGEYRSDTLSSERKTGVPSLGYRNRSMAGAFGLAAQSFNSRLGKATLQVGLYSLWDIRKQGWLQNGKTQQVFPGAELNLELNRSRFPEWNNQLNVAYGTGQRLPTFTDLYYVGPSNVANPLLQNEQAQSWQLGFRNQRRKNIWSAHHDNPDVQNIQSSVYLFSRRTDNLIDWVKNADTAKWEPRNYNQQRCQGLDIDFRYSLGPNSLRLGYLAMGMSQSEETGMISKNALNYLRQQFLLNLGRSLGEQWSVQAQLRHLQRQADKQESYRLLDFQVQYHYSWAHPYLDADRWQATLYVQVQNALNSQYREIASVPMPPRWMNIGIKFNL
jgi:iron complex outermembrane receptor protein